MKAKVNFSKWSGNTQRYKDTWSSVIFTYHWRKEMRRYILWQKWPRQCSTQCYHLQSVDYFHEVFHTGFDQYSSRNDVIGKLAMNVHLRVYKSVKTGKVIHINLCLTSFIHSLNRLFIPENFIGYSFSPLCFYKWDENIL